MLATILIWLLAITFFLLSLGSFLQNEPLPGITALLPAAYLCPPIRRAIHQSVGREISRKGRVAIAAGLFLLFLIPMSQSASRLAAEEERQAALEQARKDSVEQVRLDSIAAFEQERSRFIESAPYVTDEEYDEWHQRAKDSAADPSLTVESFLASSKHRADSIAEKQRLDSIGRMREVAEYQRKKEEEERRERARIAAEEAARQRMCTYKGHQLHRGPRGGCYYINSHGNKEYVQVDCSRCY